MKRMILAIVVSLGLAQIAPVQAQFVVGPIGPPASRSGFIFGGFGLPVQGRGVRVVGFANGIYSRPFFGNPFAPVLPGVAPLTPFGFGPGFLGPGWGVGPTWGWNPLWGNIPGVWGSTLGIASPRVIVIQQPIIVAGGSGGGDPNWPGGGGNAVAGGAPPPPQQPAEEPRPLGAKPGAFLVIEPKKNLPPLPPPGVIVPEVDRVAAAPKPAVPEVKFDPFAAPIPLRGEKREADPEKEAARLMKLGRDAFAAGEYGKAGEHFERAAEANPKVAEPLFLKAQASFAAGAYADAVAAIRAGLALDPTWPGSTFDPKEPYGANAGNFANHLADLRKAAAANPGEPVLEFLMGYELWFIGEKVEAKKWFNAAEKRLDAPGPIALFK
jgi:hypothetical protein